MALTLLAGAGLALFTWINQSLHDVTALAQREDEVRLRLSALEVLRTINPGRQRQGTFVRADLNIDWQAEIVAPVLPNATFSPPKAGPWRVGLYRITAHVRNPRRGLAIELSFLQAGAVNTLTSSAAAAL